MQAASDDPAFVIRNKFSPLSSRPKWRDLQFSQPATDPDGSTDLPFVIPTEVEVDLALRMRIS
jgi:hypothetical protein